MPERAPTRPAPEHEPISIELSPAQIDRVLAGASADGVSLLMRSGLADVHDVRARVSYELENGRLSRSLLLGLLMLAALPADGSYTSLTELSRTLEIGLSSTHRYAATLVEAGLLERDPQTRRYRLAHAS
jgi:hypothetical protein